YASLVALTQARVTGYDANTDKSLWLLSQQDPSYEAAFSTASKQLADPPLTPDLVTQTRSGGNQRRPLPFNGVLAHAIKSVSSAQQPVALDAAAAWADYLAIDARIRESDRNGDHAGAVTLAVGDQPMQSNGALARFDANVGQLIASNQADFDREMQQ